MNTVQKIIALVIGVLLSLSGCSAKAPRGYFKSGVTVSQISSLAVLPFDNISGHQDAGKKVVNLLLTELASTELFQIAEVGEVEKSLRSLRIRTTAELDLSKLQNLGEQLNVQAIIVGSVDEYEVRQERSGAVPVVAVSVRMLEVQTGDILWAISNAHDGNDWETVFGFGRIISLSQLAQIVVSEMVESLLQELKASSEAKTVRSPK
jgi:TolB-like protein